jgi:hypothetical protein
MAILEKCLPKPAPVQTPMDAEEVRLTPIAILTWLHVGLKRG